MNLQLRRDIQAGEFTLGQLYLNSVKFCETLEDPVREIPGVPVEQWKIAGATAIPRGLYSVVMDHSERFGRRMLRLCGVPGFTGIRVHGANTTANVRGCIGVGQVRLGAGQGRILSGLLMCHHTLSQLEARVNAALQRGEAVFMDVC